MEYLDIYDQLGGVKQERFPSPGSYKHSPECDAWRYKWDYKTPFRETPYAIRRKRPTLEDDVQLYTNVDITEQEIDEQLALTPAYKSK